MTKDNTRLELDSIEGANEIYASYIKDYTGYPYKGIVPFPDNGDTHQSFGISLSKDGEKLVYKCFNEHRGGDVRSFITRMEGIPYFKSKDIGTKILRGLIKPKYEITNRDLKKKSKSNLDDRIVEGRLHLTDWELEWWWDECQLSSVELMNFEIYGLENYTSASGRYTIKSTKEKPMFLYPYFDEDRNMIGFKIYNPKAGKNDLKWISGGDRGVVGNIFNYTGSGKIYVASSKKDAAVLYYHIFKKKYNCGYLADENNFKPLVNSPHRDQFIYIGDKDFKIGRNGVPVKAGQMIAQAMTEEYDIPHINVNFGFNNKDITEGYKDNKTNFILSQIFK